MNVIYSEKFQIKKGDFVIWRPCYQKPAIGIALEVFEKFINVQFANGTRVCNKKECFKKNSNSKRKSTLKSNKKTGGVSEEKLHS